MRRLLSLAALLRATTWGAAFAGLFLVSAFVQAQAPSSAPCHAPRAGDEWWSIVTRELPDCAAGTNPQPQVRRRTAGGDWQAATLDEFAAGQADDVLTCIYVHGNRMDCAAAAERSQFIYGCVLEAADPKLPVRWVTYSWPSDQVRGPLKDVRSKAQRTDVESYYLGSILTRLPDRGRVSLLGYSFGARIIAGALELRAGGQVASYTLSKPASPGRLKVRAAMGAAAENNGWLSPGATHGMALGEVDRLFLAYNSCDPALKHFSAIDKCERGEALGYTGFTCLGCLSGRAERIVQIDVAGPVGKTHDEQAYYRVPAVVDQVQRHLFWQAVDK